MAIERRKKKIVNRMQHRLIHHILLFVIGVSVILVAATLLIFREELFTTGKCYYVHFSLLFVIALILYLLTFKSAISFSNRVYGPLYRLSNYLQKLSAGEVTEPISFRKGDVINGIKQAYNELINSLRKTIHYDYKELAKTFTQLQDLLDKIHNKTITEGELYNDLQNVCNRLARALDITSETIEKKEL